jgi:hypothetical protein
MNIGRSFNSGAFFLLAICLAGSPKAFAVNGPTNNCKAPSAEKLSELSAYVVKRSRFDPAGQLILLESAPANEECFWKLHYQESTPKTEITLFLSPDEKYLSPALYDLRKDPLVEERARAESLAKIMTAGGPPAQGAANAPITIVEFSDFECPFCQRMSDVLEKNLTVEDRKDVRILFRCTPGRRMQPRLPDARPYRVTRLSGR